MAAEAETASVGGVGGGCCGDVRLHAEQPEQLSLLLVSSWVVVMSSSDMLAKPKVSQNSPSSHMAVLSALLLDSSSELLLSESSSELLLSESSSELLLLELLLPESSSASFSLSSIFSA